MINCVKITRVVILSMISGMFFYSCTKTDNPTPSTIIEKPSIVLTPDSAAGIAGDLININYTMAAKNGMQTLKIEEQFQSNPVKTVKDSTFFPGKYGADLVWNFHIPDSAAPGQKSVVTFTLNDTKGNQVIKKAVVYTTGSRPQITVNQNNTKAAAGDSVIFTITLKSSENNLTALDITQSVNGSSSAPVTSFTYNNEALVNASYTYNIPATAKTGDHYAIFFTATNKDGVKNMKTAVFDIL